MGRHVSVAVALGFAFTALTGCVSWKGPEPLQTFKPLKETSSVLAADEAASKLVAMSQLQADRESDGRLKLVLELNNLSSLDLPVQVQTVFRDGEGSLYGDETNWQMVTLPGGGDYRYEVVSLQPKADSFVVQIRTP